MYYYLFIFSFYLFSNIYVFGLFHQIVKTQKISTTTNNHNIYSSSSLSCSTNSFTTNTNSLQEWIYANIPIESRKNIEITYDKNIHRYIVKATQVIKKNDIIMTVPFQLCIGVSKLHEIIGKELCKSLSIRTGDYGLLALYLVIEYLNNNTKSIYYQYIQNLFHQESKVGLFSMSQEEINEFQYSSTRDIAFQIQVAIEDYNKILENVSVSKVFSEKEKFTKQLFFKALSIVKSRSVFLENQLYLVPGMDSIEFDPFSSSEPIIQTSGMGFFSNNKIVSINAEQTYEKGQTIVMSYGLKSSAECFEDHGIVPDLEAEDSCCEFMVALDGKEKFYDDKLDILERYDVPIRFRVDLEADPNAELDSQLLQFLRLKFIEGVDAFILESVFADKVYDILTLPFSKTNEIRVMEFLLNDFCKNKLDLMDKQSTYEQDMNIIDNNNDVIKIALARLRIQERSALLNTIGKCQIELSTLYAGQGNDPREYYQERRLRELNLNRPLEDYEINLPE